MMSLAPPTPAQLADPFGEKLAADHRRSFQVLGGQFEFRGGRPECLDLVDRAYAGLPAQRLAEAMPSFEIQLVSSPVDDFEGRSEPPEARMLGGAGFFGALIDAANLAMVFPEARRGVVALSQGLLRYPYHARYELLEFAVFTLACRAQGLVPLHAACVGWQGAGALLIGDSGAGKSTLALQCLQQGLDFLTEDAAFVDPQRLLATGVANFLHLREDGLDWVGDAALAAQIRQSPVIRRRSGVAKYELDLRQTEGRLAAGPLKLASVVFLSQRPADGKDPWLPLDEAELRSRLTATQAYAARQAGWAHFVDQCAGLRGYELRRGDPRDAAIRLQAGLDKAAHRS